MLCNCVKSPRKRFMSIVMKAAPDKFKPKERQERCRRCEFLADFCRVFNLPKMKHAHRKERKKKSSRFAKVYRYLFRNFQMCATNTSTTNAFFEVFTLRFWR